jgi:hypothetical protein
MTLVTHTLYHPRRPDGSTGSAFAIHFTPKGDEVEVVNHLVGGMGAMFPIKAARAYYKQKLKEGYTT